MATTTRKCEARDPNNCAYHTNQARVEQFLRQFQQPQPVPTEQVDVTLFQEQPQVAQEAFARYGITTPPPELAKAWNQQFTILDEELPDTPEQYAKKALQLPLDPEDGYFPTFWVHQRNTPLHPGTTMHQLDSTSQHLADASNHELLFSVDLPYPYSPDEGEEDLLTALTSNPNYIDHDMSGEYSENQTIYLQLDNSEQFQHSFQKQERKRMQEQAGRLLAGIKDGYTPPWAVATQKNRQHAAAARALQSELNKLISKQERLPWRVTAFAQQEQADAEVARMDAVADALQAGDAQPFIEMTRNRSFTRSPYLMQDPTMQDAVRKLSSSAAMKKAEEDERQRQMLAEKEDLLRAAYQEGRLPKELGNLDDLLKALRRQVGTPSAAWKQQAEAKRYILKTIRTVNQQYAEAKDLEARIQEAETQKEEMDRLEYIFWPGN